MGFFLIIEKYKKPGLFRVHDKPSEDKYNNFLSYVNELGLDLSSMGERKAQPEPMDYCHILEKIAGRPDQELIQTMLLRSMRQAVYQSENIGHFGLALPSYSHFTSPIRRYPDLVVHRVIKAILDEQAQHQANAGEHSYTPEAVIELGEHCSMTERRADDATRDVSDWLKCEYMQDHVGDTFTGVISTVTNFGLFIRLADLHIEGLVHITSLGHDYYHFDDVRMCLTGENTGAKYRIGDTVQVQVAAVNLDEKKIDLALAGENAVTKRAKPASKSKSGDKHKRGKGSAGKAKAQDQQVQPNKKSAKPDDKASDTTTTKAKKRKVRKKRPGKNARKIDD
jgi:ribonuclease R